MLGLKGKVHKDGVCHVRDSLWCSQCSCYGHLPDSCTVAKHVWRPRTLEELISADLRERWNINTETHIIWPGKPLTLEDAEREIAENNTIDVVYKQKHVIEIMRKYKIPTVHKMEGNIQKLRLFAIANGKKVRLIQKE